MKLLLSIVFFIFLTGSIFCNNFNDQFLAFLDQRIEWLKPQCNYGAYRDESYFFFCGREHEAEEIREEFLKLLEQENHEAK